MYNHVTWCVQAASTAEEPTRTTPHRVDIRSTSKPSTDSILNRTVVCREEVRPDPSPPPPNFYQVRISISTHPPLPLRIVEIKELIVFTLLLIFYFFFRLSISIATTVSDLPATATEATPVENTSQWLRNLDVDFDSVNATPPTPCSTHLEGASTPALPQGIEESVGTATPRRFAPEVNEDARTVSERTYDEIRKSSPEGPRPPLSSFVFITLDK